jgi:hypothetical protein
MNPSLQEVEQFLKALGAACATPSRTTVVATLGRRDVVLRAGFRVTDEEAMEALAEVPAPPDEAVWEELQRRVLPVCPSCVFLSCEKDGASKARWRVAARWSQATNAKGLALFVALALALSEAAHALAVPSVLEAYVSLCRRGSRPASV